VRLFVFDFRRVCRGNHFLRRRFAIPKGNTRAGKPGENARFPFPAADALKRDKNGEFRRVNFPNTRISIKKGQISAFM